MLMSCRKIKKSFGEKVVLDGIDLDINCGDRIGLVARNGAGKTTLANILMGYLDYDEGSIITARQQINIGYLCQSQSELTMDTINSHGVNDEFQRLVSHLGIKKLNVWSEERLKNLSGGEKTKIAIAGVWASQPDLVILDEPTNHLDYAGIKYLISELSNFQGAAIIISHDRYFLDQTVAKIAEIEKGQIKIYPGNYSAFREAKQIERASIQHAYESQRNEQSRIESAITQLKTWSDKAHRESRQKAEGRMGGKEYYRNKAKKRDQAIKSQIKRLEKQRQEAIERPEADVKVNFNLNPREKGGRRLLEADGISKSYGELRLFTGSSFYICRGEKVGILGPNGCGKTTLIKTILGQECLDAGKIFVSSSARAAYVGQELPQREEVSVKELIKNWTRDVQHRTCQLLISLGIAYDRLQVAMGDLSRGERMKIGLGLAVMGEYDLLILDEPTNHLDLYSREALEESLTQFPGTILIISHDHYLLQRVCDHMLVFNKCKISRIEGKLENHLTKNSLAKSPSDSNNNSDEELLLLDTRISRVLSELCLHKPEQPAYVALDQEYQKLVQRRKELGSWPRT